MNRLRDGADQLGLGHGMTLKPGMHSMEVRCELHQKRFGVVRHHTVHDLWVEALERDPGSNLPIKILFSLPEVGPLGHPESFYC